MNGQQARRHAGSRAAGAHLHGVEHRRSGAPSSRRCSTSPATCCRAASRRGCTSGSSTTTRSRPTCSPSRTRARSAATSSSRPRSSRAASLAAVEKAINEELARFVKEGPTADELARVKTQYFAAFMRGIERIGGFGGKSDILATNQVYGGDPAFYKTRLAQRGGGDRRRGAQGGRGLARPTASTSSRCSRTRSSRPPAPAPTARSFPDPGKLPTATLPATERATLANGLKVDRGASRRRSGGQPRPARRRRLGRRRRQRRGWPRWR